MRVHYLFLLLLSGTSLADDVGDVLQQSSFAGVISIHAGDLSPHKDSERSNCGSSYVAYANAARVFVNDIDWIEGYPIEFRAASTLELGGTYLVFLNEKAMEVSNAMQIHRELRTDRCMKGGITLVPVFVNTPSIGFDAVFQEWRSIVGASIGDETRYLNYFLAHSEFKNFFRPTSEVNGEPLGRTSLEIHKFYGLTKPDAYLSDDVLELVAHIACGLRKGINETTNNLRISACAQL